MPYETKFERWRDFIAYMRSKGGGVDRASEANIVAIVTFPNGDQLWLHRTLWASLPNVPNDLFSKDKLIAKTIAKYESRWNK